MFTRIFLCAFLAGISFTLSAQRNNEEVLVDRQSLASADIRWVEADTEGGNISVEGVPDTDARIEVYARSRGTEESIKQRYSDNYDVKINTKNGKLTVSAKRKKSGKRDPEVSVSFRLYVPVSASNELHTSGGNIHCRHLSGGRQKVMTSGGNIHARQSKGRMTLFTSGGNISLNELSGAIKAETSGGNVGAENIIGALTTSSSGGNLSLRELSCSLEASTGGGNIDAMFRKMVDYIKLRNRGSGHTQLQLPDGIGMNIQATGNSVKMNNSSAFDGDISEHEVKGSVNGGGIPVTIDGGDSKVVVTIR